MKPHPLPIVTPARKPRPRVIPEPLATLARVSLAAALGWAFVAAVFHLARFLHP